MNLRPLEDRVVIRPKEPETITAGGIHLPANAQEKSQRGEVLAVGPGRWSDSMATTMPLDISVGDTVIFGRGGLEVTIDLEKVLVLSSRDVIGVLENAPTVLDGPVLAEDLEPF